MKNIKLALIDYDLSSSSRKLVAKFEGSPFFNLIRQTFSRSEGENMLVDGTADAVLIIPYNFEKKLVNENSGKVQLVINAINGTSAALINAY